MHRPRRWRPRSPTAAVVICRGQLFPLALLPAGLQRLVSFTPFPSIISFPVGVMAGTLAANEVVAGLAIQVLWAAIFIGAHRLLWRAGLRRYGAVGA